MTDKGVKRNIGMPYSEETERIVLGTLLIERDSLVGVNNLLNEDCFYNDFHRKIFRAIRALDKCGKRYDILSVWNSLRNSVDETQDRPVYFEIASYQCFDLQQHAMELNRLMAHRKNYEIAQYILSTVHSCEDPFEVQDEVMKRIEGIRESQSSGVANMREVMQEVYDIINANLNNPEPVTGTPTGFRELDRRGVLRPGNLTVVAADSSQGKTSLATSICANGASAGAKIAFYTMEMKPVEIGQRILSKQSGVDGMRISSSQLTQEELSQVDRGIARLMDLPLYFDGKSTSTIDSVISSIRMMKKRYDIDGAVVDYLQIFSANSGNNGTAEQDMGNIARRLKNIAKDLGIWVMALSQLSRDKVDVAPNIGRIRGSGQITEAADVVLLLYRPEHYGRDKKYPEPFANVSPHNTAMIDVAKGRNVGTWKFICGFNANTTQFYDLSDMPCIDPSKTDEEEKSPF